VTRPADAVLSGVAYTSHCGGRCGAGGREFFLLPIGLLMRRPLSFLLWIFREKNRYPGTARRE